MSIDGGAAGHPATPPLPTSIWVLAYASVAGQLVALAQRGASSNDGTSLAISVILGALLIGYVSAGVVRARTVRLVLAWIVLGISALGELISVVLGDLVHLPSLAISVVSLAALWKFRQSSWYAWQRTKPPAREGAPITNLVAIAVFVGVLGGFVGPVDTAVDVEVRVSAHQSPQP